MFGLDVSEESRDGRSDVWVGLDDCLDGSGQVLIIRDRSRDQLLRQ